MTSSHKCAHQLIAALLSITVCPAAVAAGCSLSPHAVTCQVPSKTPITLKAKADTIGTFVNTAQVSVGNNLNSTTANVTVWRSTCGDVTFGGANDQFSGCPGNTYDPNNADRYPPSVINCCVSTWTLSRADHIYTHTLCPWSCCASSLVQPLHCRLMLNHQPVACLELDILHE